ncbi:MAG TPA: hypothetical protein PKV70_03905, partial [Thermodesulfobacteriota bacterium]|nr:hypothetical protein [Thermodesulfobacteriota bacterium]
GRDAPAFFEKMALGKKDFRFFAEIRVNQRGKTLKAYRQGGLVAVQAGIEEAYRNWESLEAALRGLEAIETKTH